MCCLRVTSCERRKILGNRVYVTKQVGLLCLPEAFSIITPALVHIRSDSRCIWFENFLKLPAALLRQFLATISSYQSQVNSSPVAHLLILLQTENGSRKSASFRVQSGRSDIDCQILPGNSWNEGTPLSKIFSHHAHLLVDPLLV